QLTYRALNHRANQLTCRLQQLGVGPGVHVGLCLDRSIELIVGMLGILKAGGAYVPLDPASPRERLAFMVQDSQARVLVAREGLGEALQGLGLPVVSLDPEWQALAKEPAAYVNSGAHSGHPAYVMYTSGSTGTPKGVEIQHRSIARLLFGGAYARLGRDETILHLAATSFDAATFEVWGALLHGARCVLFPERLPTPKSIGAALQKYGVTTLWLTASLFNAVIDEAPEGLKGVRQLLTGGEALSVTHIRRALELLPTTQLINGYGPTESTTFTCCYPIPKNLPRNTRSIPIGRPIGNTQVYVLDRSLHPVPIGVPGELHIGGAGLARGYLNRPELTAEKFIAHPFGPEPGAVLYKTGDLVRYLPDGTLEFLGRRDQQIKLRGFRVELGEIETVLGLHPAVKEALVQVYESGYHEKRLIAYVVLGQEQPVADQELRDFLSRRLPDYMLPATFLVLDALPITPNGKIDRRALPLPASTHRPAEAAVVPPTHIAHFQLLQIWEELLEARPIGITDNFFHLGGHSLLAARLVDRIEQVFQKKITLASLFAGPTIEQLAAALEQQPTRQQTRTPLVAVQAGGARRPFFFAHGDWNSGAFYCFPLARALGPEQPFYVLEPYKFDGLRVPPTFEEVATAHLQAIRALQPEGPYLLGGFCNGGLVAYEMARQLEAAGQKVALLLLIDPATPAPRSQQFIHHLLNHLGALTHLGPDKTLNLFLRLRYGYISLRHYYRYLRIPHYRNKIDHERSIDTKGQFQPKKKKPFLPGVKLLRQEWGAMYRWVISAYAPGPYAGKITIFWPREELFHQTGWAGVARGAKEEVHIIPGTHDTCRTDHLTILAEHLKACLLQAQEA
ncbi:MAG TPA: amino acid adenylation domain-containing protein, partial [Ktedonobacteraceae bacterium]